MNAATNQRFNFSALGLAGAVALMSCRRLRKPGDGTMSGPTYYKVCKPGDYQGRVVTEADCMSMASNYDPASLDAPLTLDHSQEGPAYGWTVGLKYEDGWLQAAFRDVATELQDQSAFEKPSIEFAREINGKPGASLLAVTLLGAALPAVTDAPPVKFPSQKFKAEGIEVFALGALAKNGSRSSRGRPPARGDGPEGSRKLTVQLAAAMASSDASATAAQQALANLDQLSVEARLNEFKQFLNAQIAWGNLAPRAVRSVPRHFAGAGLHGQALRRKWKRHRYREALQGVPEGATKIITTAVIAQNPGGEELGRKYSGPVDQARLALHKKALRIRQENPKLSYEKAVSLAQKEN